VGRNGDHSLNRDIPRFTGRSEHALDDKGRLVIPARFRERLGAGFIVTIALPDPCLALYPLATWENVCERLEAAPLKDAQYRKFVRHLFAHSDETACDAQGRLLIAPALRAYAGLEREAVSIGSLTRVEIWAKERLDTFNPSADEAGAFMTELGLY
jgi:MraZ protein